MAWGGDFAGDPYAMKMYGVMVMEITGGTPIGTPDAGCTLMLLGSALTALAVIRRKLN
jgi:hypothetical protein